MQIVEITGIFYHKARPMSRKKIDGNMKKISRFDKTRFLRWHHQ